MKNEARSRLSLFSMNRFLAYNRLDIAYSIHQRPGYNRCAAYNEDIRCKMRYHVGGVQGMTDDYSLAAGALDAL